MENHIIKTKQSTQTLEGAGVHLFRVFGFCDTKDYDPFLLLDDFHSSDPYDYLQGFPWHPHRGIETITYMISGEIEHKDSIGNSGTIKSGDVQWMTAGSGIIHQEMPKIYEGFMQGFQFWVNLPKSEKMCEPKYRDVLSKQIPAHKVVPGVEVKIIAGNVDGIEGPVKDITVPIRLLDYKIRPNTEFYVETDKDMMLGAYVFEGEGLFNDENIESGKLIIFKDCKGFSVKTGEENVRFMLFQGKRLEEQIAWRGPIVMNTQKEIDEAYMQLEDNSFINRV